MRTILLLAMSAALAAGETVVMEIPAVKSQVGVKGQSVAVTASGAITKTSAAWGKDAYRITVKADLGDLQEHLTELLAAQLNKDNPCGEFLAIQKATFVPMEPAGMLTAHLKYERTLCAKAFGRQVSKKMVSGNGVVAVKITPVVEANKTVRFVPEVGRIEADGSLGELLRSSQVGERVREKIEESMVTSIQKAANAAGTLPSTIQSRVSIQNARFQDAGGGRLVVLVTGEVKMTADQEKTLAAAMAGQD